jgi:uncharacterized protein YjiK
MKHKLLTMTILACLILSYDFSFGAPPTLEGTFAFTNANGLALHPASGNLFITDGLNVFEVTPQGATVSSFTPAGNVQGVTFLPNNNLLLLIQGASAMVREYTPTGEPVVGGAEFPAAAVTGNGIAYNAFTNTIFLSDSNAATIYEYNFLGELLSSFLTTDAVSSLAAPKGVAVNPRNGNLLITADGDANQPPGSSRLYEFTTLGLLASSVQLSASSDLGNPAGVALDAAAQTLFIAFTQQNIVGVFQFDGSDLGISLTLEYIFNFSHASGIAIHPASGNLFITDGFGQRSDIVETTRLGEVVSSFQTPPGNVQGLTFLPSGNLLLPFQGPGATIQEYTTAGVHVDTGINFTTAPEAIDGDGIAYNDFTKTIFLADDDDATIHQYTLSGILLSSFRTREVVPGLLEPEGLTVNPLNGNLIIADDSDTSPAQPPGSSSLYEFTTAGYLVNSVKLSAFNGVGDSEGVAIDPATRTIFIAFDRQNVVGVFRFRGLGVPVSEPPAVAFDTRHVVR